MSRMRDRRLAIELHQLQTSPPPGICAWPIDDNQQQHRIGIRMIGPDNSAYAHCLFKLEATFPPRYPLEPPRVLFLTPVYHPNIDSEGRICLGALKSPPDGEWNPSFSIGALLTTVRLLLAEPNPDDPLVPEIAQLFKSNPDVFAANAKEHARRFAAQD